MTFNWIQLLIHWESSANGLDQVCRFNGEKKSTLTRRPPEMDLLQGLKWSRPSGLSDNKQIQRRLWRESQPKSIPEEPERPHPGIKKISQARLSQLARAFHMLDGESTLPNCPKWGSPRDLRVTNTQEQIQPTVVNDPSFAEMLGMILFRQQKNTSTYLPRYTSGSAKELCGSNQHKCGLFGGEWWSRSCDSFGLLILFSGICPSYIF